MARTLDAKMTKYTNDHYVCPNCKTDDQGKFVIFPAVGDGKPHIKCDGCGHISNRKEFLPSKQHVPAAAEKAVETERGEGTITTYVDFCECDHTWDEHAKYNMETRGFGCSKCDCKAYKMMYTKTVTKPLGQRIKDSVAGIFREPESTVWRSKKSRAAEDCKVCKRAKDLANLATVYMPQSLWDWALDLIQAEHREIMLTPAFLRATTHKDGTVAYYIIPSPKTEAALAATAIENILMWKEKLPEQLINDLTGTQQLLVDMAKWNGWPDSIIIPPQEVSGAFCRRLSQVEAEAKRIPWQKEYDGGFSSVRIHSHVDMGVHHSWTDDESVDANNNVSIVMNRKGESSAKARVIPECGHRIVVDATLMLYADAGRAEWLKEGRDRAKDTPWTARWGARYRHDDPYGGYGIS